MGRAKKLKNETLEEIKKSMKCGKRRGFMRKEQGRIHGNPVADGWAGVVMRKPHEIRKCVGRTDGPTDRHGKV